LAREAFALLEAAPVRSVAGRPHVATAYAIAAELERSVYDALYLAVALAEQATLVTADVKFANAALAHPVYASRLRLLGT
jgi:predicted nucleic acid-binding protein